MNQISLNISTTEGVILVEKFKHMTHCGVEDISFE